MRAPILLISGLLLVSCGNDEGHSPLPVEADIEKLEAKLAGHQCVGDLDIWERSYRFHRNPRMLSSDNTDFGVIEFHYRKAGTIVLVPGRNLVNPDDSTSWPDSPAVQALSGRYNIKSGTLSLDSCRPLGRSGRRR